ncbi:hypothetical protein B0H17DRAFT_1214267 [Mycena rosella]|uniref:BZIP domain-containing protein n=1 Tax=Mycena rosella TaxID=1033263 RepID=A0AAD7CNC6_MYCRO|nr:hypothetical protein B0H17DRAFT_1214267 [Mycena rosella]
MDFVPTSQPFEDGDDLFTLPSAAFRPPPSLADDADDADHSESDFVDSVGSSQPFDDGEEDLRLYKTPPCLHFPAPSAWAILSDSTTDPASDSARRCRLVRRAPPVTPGAETSISTLTPSVRSRSLVYRVTPGPKAAEMQRKRERAAAKAQRIARKIHALTKKTTALRMKHRQLRAFSSGKNAYRSTVYRSTVSSTLTHLLIIILHLESMNKSGTPTSL